MKYFIHPTKQEHVIFLLHGTGGSSADLMGIGQFLDSNATLVGIDGDVFENGMRRYFKRYPNGDFDMESFKEKTDELHQLLNQIIEDNNFKDIKMSALGYSNGANILLNLFREYDNVPFDNVILFHPSSVLETSPYKDSKTNIIMTFGEGDPFITKDQFKDMSKLLKEYKFDVDTIKTKFGHQLIQEELVEAKKYLEKAS